jgi:hypothetical protein
MVERAKLIISAVVATEATATVVATAGAVKAAEASVVSAEAAVCKCSCKPGSAL